MESYYGCNYIKVRDMRFSADLVYRSCILYSAFCKLYPLIKSSNNLMFILLLLQTIRPFKWLDVSNGSKIYWAKVKVIKFSNVKWMIVSVKYATTQLTLCISSYLGTSLGTVHNCVTAEDFEMISVKFGKSFISIVILWNRNYWRISKFQVSCNKVFKYKFILLYVAAKRFLFLC